MNSLTLLLILFFVVVVIVGLFVKKILGNMHQLAAQNRLLVALQELDRLILTKSVTTIETLSQDIVDLSLKNLGYFFISIALIDEKDQTIKRIAISKTPGLKENQKYIPLPIERQVVSLKVTDNLYVKAALEKKSFSSQRLYDIHNGIFPPQVSDEMQKRLRIKGVVVYPLVAEDKVFGVIGYGSGTPLERLSEFEYSIMGDFAAEVARSLDHVLLYQNLKVVSQQLTQANIKLKELDQLKDDFVSVASHELRTPMTAIKSYTWMALHGADIPLTEKMKKYLSRTLLSTERLINLVNDMLNVSRIEAGRIEISPKAFDIVGLVKDVVDEVNPRATEQGLHLSIVDTQTPKVFADPDKIHEVLLNLVGNALKFTPSGGTITISFFSDGQVVETSVKDSGSGIARDDLGRLFQKFGRLDNTYVSIGTSGGTGLGLYISKNLVELMHGKIWAQSEGLGRGATFSFSLPVASQELLAQAEKYHIKPEGEAKELEPVAI